MRPHRFQVRCFRTSNTPIARVAECLVRQFGNSFSSCLLPFDRIWLLCVCENTPAYPIAGAARCRQRGIHTEEVYEVLYNTNPSRDPKIIAGLYGGAAGSTSCCGNHSKSIQSCLLKEKVFASPEKKGIHYSRFQCTYWYGTMKLSAAVSIYNETSI